MPAAPSDSRTSAPALSASVEPREVTIGDSVRVTVMVGEPGKQTEIVPLAIPKGSELGAFRVLESTGRPDGELVLVLEPTSTGRLEIPSFEVEVRVPGSTARRLRVAPLQVAVNSVLGEGDATLADLRPQVELPVPWAWKTMVLWALGIVSAALLAYGIFRWAKRERSPAPRPEQALPPGVTPEAWVRGELEALLARGLVEAGRHREFHIGLADLLRRYLELRYRVPAMERTTEEIELELGRALLPGDAIALTGAVLRRCDRVKFAKHEPVSGEVRDTVELTQRLVDLTAPAPVPASGAESSPTGVAEGAAVGGG